MKKLVSILSLLAILLVTSGCADEVFVQKNNWAKNNCAETNG
ncbi:MAG: hypothetical protein RR587_07470 [Solibacillus sp.]